MAIFSAIGAAVSAVSAWIGGLGIIGTTLLKAAVGVGLNLAAQSLAGKSKEPTFSVNGALTGGGDTPRSFILGRTATAGSLVWANSWGKDGETPNAYFTQVIALSDLPSQDLDEVWVNGAKVTLDKANPHPQYGWPVVEYPNALWIKLYDGSQTAADPFLVSTASNANRIYESTRIGRGVSYAIATAKVSKNLFSGFPTYKFVVTGCNLYDISRDSSAGGNGPQRWDDPSTWGGDGDHFPAVQAYNLLRGLTYGNKWFYGLQRLSAPRLPAANWIAQINKCRAIVAGADGPEPTYRSAGEIEVNAPLANALEAILTTCQGRVAETGGVYRLYLGAPDLPTFSFSDADILSTEEQSFTPFFGLADTINGISGKYPSPADGWAVKTAPPLIRTDLEALHGNRRLMADTPFDMVPYAEQVQRLMRSALQEAQRARRHTFVLPPQFWPYAVPGEICAFTSARNGYAVKQFRIDGVSDRANLDVMVDLTEVDPSDYSWNSSTDFHPPVDGALGPIRPAPQPIVDWYAEPAYVPDNQGKPRRPAIKISWDNAEGRLIDIVGIEFEVRLATTLVTVHGGRTEQPKVGSLLISQGLLANTEYGVRGRYIPGSDRDTPWSNWLSVITPDVRLTSDDVYNLDLTVFGEDVEELHRYTGESFAALRDDIRALATFIVDQGLVNYDDKAELRRELSAQTRSNRAEWSEEIIVATGPTSALAQRIETVAVDLGGKASASVVDVISAKVEDVDGRLVAQSMMFQELTAEIRDNTVSAIDSISIRVEEINGEIIAQGTMFQELIAEVQDTAASAIDALYVYVDSTGDALAERISGVEVSVGDGTAQSRMRASAGYTPGAGFSTRIGWEARVSVGADFRSAGWFIDVSETSSRVVVNADSFIIASEGYMTQPFVYSGGIAYMENARIGAVYFNQLQSTNGKLLLRGYGDFADISMFSA